MKSNKRLNNYISFKKETKSWCKQLKEEMIVSTHTNTRPLIVYKVRAFQNGVIKTSIQKPKKINVSCDFNPHFESYVNGIISNKQSYYLIDGNDNIIGSEIKDGQLVPFTNQ